MNVLIIERETGNVVHQSPVIVGGLNYNPSEKEHFDLAWRSAVDDGDVEEDKRDEYDFRVANP